MGQKAKVSPVIFVASILCFAFPFLTISCGGQKAASFSGVQLAIGTTVEQPQMFGPPQKQKVDPDPLTALAGLCAFVGLGLSLVGARVAIGTAISSAVGAASLLLMKSRMDNQVLNQGHGMLQVGYEAGYSLALILLVAGAVWNAFLVSQRKQDPVIAVHAPPPGQQHVSDPLGQPPLTASSGDSAQQELVTSGTRFCQACGTEARADSKFCRNCGKPMGAITQNA